MGKLTETEKKFADRLRRINDIDGDPDITVVMELAAEWDALEAKRADAINTGLALTVERDALKLEAGALESRLSDEQSRTERFKQSYDRAHREKDAAEKERDALKEQLKKVAEVVIGIPWGLSIRFDPTNLPASLQARVDAAVAQLAEAKASATWARVFDESIAGGIGGTLSDREKAVMDSAFVGLALLNERNALRAEVEKLKLSADAWEKLVAFRGADRNWANHPETVIDAFEEFLEAARAAEATKDGRP